MLGSLLLIASHFYVHPVFSAEHTLVTKRTPLLGGLLLNATLDGLLLNATAHTKLSSICKTFERPMTITVQRKQMTACVTSGGTFPRARPHGNTKKTYGNSRSMSKTTSTRMRQRRHEQKRGRIVTGHSNLPQMEDNFIRAVAFSKSSPRSGVRL